MDSQTITPTPAKQPNQPEQPPQTGCCHDPRSDHVDIHQALCLRPFLIFIRFAAMVVLILREYVTIRQATFTFFEQFRYLTHFSFIITLLYYLTVNWDFLLNVIMSGVAPKLKQAVIVLYQISVCLQVPVVIVYWGLLYQDSEQQESSSWLLAQDVGVHGFPLICLFVDFCFNMMPFMCRHLKYVFLAVFFYMLVNLVFTLRVETIYPIITWKSVQSYLTVVGSFVVVILIHLICQGIWLKCKINKIDQAKIHDEDPSKLKTFDNPSSQHL